MALLKIVTLNLLTDLSRWAQRRELLLQGLSDLTPDLVALQEVKLPDNPAKWLADQLGYSHLFLTPKVGMERNREALSILSRLPFEWMEKLELPGQNRVAQAVQIRLEGCPIVVTNSHLYWQPGESAARLRQVESWLAWLETFPGQPPCLLCGDFNSTPETAVIQRVRQQFHSAFASIHGREPEYTCPTPLPRSLTTQLRTFLGFFFLIRPRCYNPNWRGALDYIFVDPALHVRDCQTVLDQPDPRNPRIYPSDHLGLCATIEIGEQ